MEMIPNFLPGALFVALGPHAVAEQACTLAAQLALRGPLTVLDGGNRFKPYLVSRLLREKTTHISRAASRTVIRRAFTCYQMLALLENTPTLRQPYMILDLLATFYDDHVTDREARRLLDICLLHVERFRQSAPVLITLAPPLVEQRAFLVDLVCSKVQAALTPEPPPAQPRQLSFFKG
ncbi:MAG TPA: hypothetical protein VGK00_10350 [Anaerolineales bacterium]|jgi:hypothetical protein